ncbi:hypothetical protein [Pseudonocardia sp. ICBG1293]|uniref:hypothetical protein n=1 Tax=Pseudonocardia sp. ICBG1293 TaxID=2844382 RepID=UPI001CCCC944|nr:hypothetical protein [Pseudonocardia sp. ICBG1293]
MTKIRIRPGPAPEQVLQVVRATFESRDFTWQPDGDRQARASEGDAAVRDAALPTSQRLRVRVRVRPDADRVVLDQETVGAAMTGAMASTGAGPWLMITLGRRFRRIVKAVRQDLAAAHLSV